MKYATQQARAARFALELNYPIRAIEYGMVVAASKAYPQYQDRASLSSLGFQRMDDLGLSILVDHWIPWPEDIQRLVLKLVDLLKQEQWLEMWEQTNPLEVKQ